MSADGARLRPVDTPPPGGEIPVEVLRFAALSSDQRNLLMHVSELLGEITFGAVVIVLQDGKVIQIETSEKIRLR